MNPTLSPSRFLPDPSRQLRRLVGLLAGLLLAASLVRADLQRPRPEPANPVLPSIFLIGDSTMRNGVGDGAGGQWGWGEPVADFFDTTKVNVVNRAVGGVSSRTYITAGYWEKDVALLKKGDIAIIQFGHNDPGAINDSLRARASLKGNGDDFQEIDNLVTKQHEVVHSYGWYLRKFVEDAQAKGATAIICSPIPRMGWVNGQVPRNSIYNGWAADAAKQKGVGFIDVNEISCRRIEQGGRAKALSCFPPKEPVHTNSVGANLNAESVIAGSKLLPKNPLAPFFNDKGNAIPAIDLSKPAVPGPDSPVHTDQ